MSAEDIQNVTQSPILSSGHGHISKPFPSNNYFSQPCLMERWKPVGFTGGVALFYEALIKKAKATI